MYLFLPWWFLLVDTEKAPPLPSSVPPPDEREAPRRTQYYTHTKPVTMPKHGMSHPSEGSCHTSKEELFEAVWSEAELSRQEAEPSLPPTAQTLLVEQGWCRHAGFVYLLFPLFMPGCRGTNASLMSYFHLWSLLHLLWLPSGFACACESYLTLCYAHRTDPVLLSFAFRVS